MATEPNIHSPGDPPPSLFSRAMDFLSRPEAGRELGERLQRGVAKWQASDWGYVLEGMNGMDALTFMATLEREEYFEGQEFDVDGFDGDNLVERTMEEAVTAPVWLANLRDLVTGSLLDDAAKRQLDMALGYVEAHDYELAVPLLLMPLEGAFWKVAEHRQLVVDRGSRMFFGPRSGMPPRKVTGLADVLDLEQLDIDEGLRSFVRGLAYGSGIHPMRHGRAEQGWRRRALFLVIALAGWVENYGNVGDQKLLRKAWRARSEARRADSRASA